MDHCLQVAHYCAPYDPGRRAQCDVEILGRVTFKASDKQLLRWYVQSIRGQMVASVSIEMVF